jgi:preprotein translocase subunit SecA
MAFSRINKILLKIFGSRNERLIKAYSVIAQQAGKFEKQIQKLDDEALKAKTADFKGRLESGTKPEDILPETFAVVREAAQRNVQMRHFDVQLIGGDVL